jgi:hypothetical protein
MMAFLKKLLKKRKHYLSEESGPVVFMDQSFPQNDVNSERNFEG